MLAAKPRTITSFCRALFALAPLVIGLRANAQLAHQVIQVAHTGDETSLFTNGQLATIPNDDYPYPHLCSAYFEYQRVALTITLDDGEDHDLGANPFSATLDFTVLGQNDDGTVFESVQQLTINENRPEATYRRNLTWQWSDLSDVMINNPALTVDGINPARVHMRVAVTVDRRMEPPVQPLRPDFPEVTNGDGNQVHFHWDPPLDLMGEVPEPGCQTEFPGYELQVLRLFERADVPPPADPTELTLTEVDWAQAASFMIDNGARDIDLILAEGTGFYAWRVRVISNWHSAGAVFPGNWGPWSDAPGGGQLEDLSIVSGYHDFGLGIKLYPVTGQGNGLFYYEQFDEDRNWIYSRTFTEGSVRDDVPLRVSEKITYATTLQQVQQEQTCLQESNDPLVGQTVLDLVGRPAIQSLPVPLPEQPSIGFVPHLLDPKDRNTSDDPVEVDDLNACDFDQDIFLGQDLRTEDVNGPRYFNYYSDDNTNTEVPDATGFPYTHTTFHIDGRVKQASAPGQDFAFTGSQDPRTPKTYYSGVSSEELTRVFGDQAYDPATVHQVITTDANGVTSTSYQDKEGHILATSLIHTGFNNDLIELNEAATSAYDITGHIGANEATNDVNAVEAHTTFTVDPPGGTVDFDYHIDPATITDACEKYCASCDALVELFLVNVDDPSATNLMTNSVLYPGAAAHRITPIPSVACPQEGPVPTHTFTFSMSLPPGTYILTRRLTTNNDNNNGTPMIDVHQDAVEDIFTNLLGTQLNTTLAALNSTPPDLDAAFATGTINHDRVIWDVGCSSVTMPIDECPECHDDATTMLEVLRTMFQEAAPTLNGDSDPNNDVPQTISDGFLFGFLTYQGHTYSVGQFSGLIANLRNDLLESERRYPCERIQGCWMGACQTFINNLVGGSTNIDLDDLDTSELPGGTGGVTGTIQLEIMDLFLNCLGRHVEQYASSTDDFLRHAYSSTQYDPATGGPCVDLVEQHYEASGATFDWTDTGNWDNEITETTANGTFTITGWALFESCMNSQQNAQWSSGLPPNDAEAEAMLEERIAGIEDVCYQACYARRNAFLEATAAMDDYFTTPQERHCAGMQVLAQCYADCHGLEVVHDANGHPLGIGPEAQASLIQNIISGHFTLAEGPNGGAPCTTGHRVSTTGNVPPAFLLPQDDADLVTQLNNALDALPVFILQREFQDFGRWHLEHDSPQTDLLVWDRSESCLRIEARIGIMAEQGAPSCPGCNVVDGFCQAACLDNDCAPLSTFRIAQVEITIGGHPVFGAHFSDVFMPLSDVAAALSSGHAFTTTMGRFAAATGGIDFVKANNTAWPTGDLPLYSASAPHAPVTSVELLHGNTYAAANFTTNTREDLFGDHCVDASCHGGKDVCITWLPGFDIDLNEGDPIGLMDCATVIAQNYRETLLQHWAQTIMDARDDVRQRYTATCADPHTVQDGLSFSYQRKQYQYTLYYYDRAGNLINTVAPAQVKTMEVAHPTVDPEDWRTTTLDQAQRTTYVHNSLGQVVQQTTPNGGTTRSYLDLLGRPRITQDAQQLEDKVFTYTLYDALGRVTEVGQAPYPDGVTDLEVALGGSYANIAGYLSQNPTFPTQGRTFRTITTYTTPAFFVAFSNGRPQRFLQNRVSYARTDEDGILATRTDQVTTYYSYDPHGNVEWLIQDIPALGRSYVAYDYDLISGRVREVRYNEGMPDQFFHRYAYDADGRILRAETSTDGTIWDRDASYTYFKHGPLQRTRLGEDAVQGTDHTYTIRGWLKGINDPRLSGQDAGHDGVASSHVARDAFGMVLGYYENDFQHTGSVFEGHESVRNSDELFNGNIPGWGFNTQKADDEPGVTTTPAFEDPLAFQFRYDELNRLREAKGMEYITSPAGWAANGTWDSDQSYDRNGNLKTAKRHDGQGNITENFAYNYLAPDGWSPDRLQDISGTFNGGANGLTHGHAYEYFKNGELSSDHNSTTADHSGDVDVHKWDPYGKVRHIQSGDEHIHFLYDASGQRVAKAVTTVAGTYPDKYAQPVHEGDNATFYVRDAQGNILATYRRSIALTADENDGNALVDDIYLDEEPIYGSARLGVRRADDLRVRHRVWNNGNYTQFQGGFQHRSTLSGLTVAQLAGDELFEHHLTADQSPPALTDDESTKDVVSSACLQRAEDVDGQLLFSSRAVLDPFDNTTHLYLTDRAGVPMVNSNGMLADWTRGAISAALPGEEEQHYLFTIGEDGQPYAHRIDLAQATITLGEVMDKNAVLDPDASNYGYSGAMAALDDRSSEGRPWVYFKRFASGLTQVVGVDLLQLVQDKNTTVTVLADIAANDDAGAYDEMQIDPQARYLALITRQDSGIWATHCIRLYTIGEDHATLTPADSLHVPGTTISSLDFSPTGDYLYYVGSNEMGNDLYRVPVSGLGAATPELMSEEVGDVRRTATNGMLLTAKEEVRYIEQPDAAAPAEGTIATKNDWQPAHGGNFLPDLPLQPHILKGLKGTSRFARALGDKRYELTDHLGNVRAVLTDRKLTAYNSTTDVTSNFHADITSRADYYPFGSLLPGRNYDATSDAYRFGFQGQEADKEINGERNSYAFTYRFHDPRIGRFLSLDPLAWKFPFYSPYHFSSNSPIVSVDIEGLESSFRLNYTEGSVEVIDGQLRATDLKNFEQGHRWGFSEGGLPTTPSPGVQFNALCLGCGTSYNHSTGSATIWIRPGLTAVTRDVDVVINVPGTPGTPPTSDTEPGSAMPMPHYMNSNTNPSSAGDRAVNRAAAIRLVGYRTSKILAPSKDPMVSTRLTSIDMRVKSTSGFDADIISGLEGAYGVKVNLIEDASLTSDWQYTVNYAVTTTTPGTAGTPASTRTETRSVTVPAIEPIE